MIDFYIKQNLDIFELKFILEKILNLESEELLIIKNQEFYSNNSDYNGFEVICVYHLCTGDVSLLIQIFDRSTSNNFQIIENIKKVSKINKLDFFLPDEDTPDMGAFLLYSLHESVIKNYTIQENDGVHILFLKILMNYRNYFPFNIMALIRNEK